jgi:hypothetical protein
MARCCRWLQSARKSLKLPSMANNNDRDRAAAAMGSRAALKNYLHQYVGLPLAVVRRQVDEILKNATDSKETKPLSRAGVARAARDFQEIKEQRLNLLYSQVFTAAHAKWIAYRSSKGPLPEQACWATVNGEKTILEPWQRVRHGFALEMALQLQKELDDCPDDDEVEAMLLKNGWDEDAIDSYIEEFGKVENNAKL